MWAGSLETSGEGDWGEECTGLGGRELQAPGVGGVGVAQSQPCVYPECGFILSANRRTWALQNQAGLPQALDLPVWGDRRCGHSDLGLKPDLS